MVWFLFTCKQIFRLLKTELQENQDEDLMKIFCFVLENSAILFACIQETRVFGLFLLFEDIFCVRCWCSFFSASDSTPVAN